MKGITKWWVYYTHPKHRKPLPEGLHLEDRILQRASMSEVLRLYGLCWEMSETTHEGLNTAQHGRLVNRITIGVWVFLIGVQVFGVGVDITAQNWWWLPVHLLLMGWFVTELIRGWRYVSVWSESITEWEREIAFCERELMRLELRVKDLDPTFDLGVMRESYL